MLILQSDLNQRKKLLEASDLALVEAVPQQGLEFTWGNPEIIKTLQVILSYFEEEFTM